MDGLLSLLVFAGFFYLMMRFGCGAHMVHGHGEHSGHSEGGNKNIDPVCGVEVATNEGYGRMYEDTLYRFCSRDCLDKFDADPGHYLSHEKGETQ